MIGLTVLLIIISIFEIKGMLDKNQKKEMYVFIGLTILTWVIGTVYFSNKYSISIASMIMDVFGIKR